jgi:ribose/xylose/arabinose/galactoside ABC-type transport system permease subunit
MNSAVRHESLPDGPFRPLEARARRLRQITNILERLGIWLALVLLLIAAYFISPSFVTAVNLLNVVRQASVVGIAAIGVTLVMITGAVDLSIGAVISLSAVLAATLMAGHNDAVPSSIAVVLLVGLAIGIANGLLVAYFRLPSFILTLGTATAITGMTQLFTGGTAAGVVAPGFRETFNVRYGPVPLLAIAFVVIAVGGFFIQRRTKFGLRLFLIGANRRAARLAGVQVERTLVLAFAAAGVAGALAGLALLARSGVSSSYAGRGFDFDVLAAVILGGTTFQGGRGGIGGTIAGVLLLAGFFNLAVIVGLSVNSQLIVKGAVIVGAATLYAIGRRTD